MYPKAAKFTVWSIALIFTAALALLLIAMSLENQKNVSTAMIILLVLGLPLKPASQYVIDPVGKAVRELQFVDDPSLLNLIRPLLNGIDRNVRVGQYASDELNAFAISSVFGKESAIAFS